MGIALEQPAGGRNFTVEIDQEILHSDRILRHEGSGASNVQDRESSSRHPDFGSVTTKDVPRGARFSTTIVPPCASTIRFEMLRPRP